MRIGTWNVDGRWTATHAAMVASLNCDVWLITEPPVGAGLDGYGAVTTEEFMQPGKHWAAVWSHLDMTAHASQPRTTATASVGGYEMWSSVLPWRGAGGRFPGPKHADWTRSVLAQLRALGRQPAVWGGDWNNSLVGPERAGSLDGRDQVLALVEEFGLAVPTAALPHRIAELRSIDHVALAPAWAGTGEHVPALVGGKTLSDHDIYIVECEVA